MAKKHWLLGALYALCSMRVILCSDNDITANVFGSLTNVTPAAFGDFNSDELTDLFVVNENMNTIMILEANSKEPFFSFDSRIQCAMNSTYQIASVVPGDFDGDALMDVLITCKKKGDMGSYVFVHWGGLNHINCSQNYTIRMMGEPLAIDYDKNMTIDLFGMNEHSQPVFWIFSRNRTAPQEVPLNNSTDLRLTVPHSHAFLDLNNDNSPDLFLTTDKNSFSIWLYDNNHENNSVPFVYYGEIEYPRNLAHSDVSFITICKYQSYDIANIIFVMLHISVS